MDLHDCKMHLSRMVMDCFDAHESNSRSILPDSTSETVVEKSSRGTFVATVCTDVVTGTEGFTVVVTTGVVTKVSSTRYAKQGIATSAAACNF